MSLSILRRNAWVRKLFIIILNAVMLSVVMLSVVAWISNLYYKAFYSGNGTACFKKCKQLFEYNIYSYLETSDGQSSNLYLNVVYSFNMSVI
jgi:hypothetical protein